MSGPKWWEKTVEYRFLEMLFTEIFIQRELKPGSCIAPLDGIDEKEAGDAILKLNRKWLLIEFKRDETCLSSEIQKYGSVDNYNSAKDKLLNDGDHHFFIYGDSQSSTVLNLKSQLYWGDKALALAQTLTKDLTQAQAKAKAKVLALAQDLTKILTKAQAKTLIPVTDLEQAIYLNQALAQVQTLTKDFTKDLTQAKVLALAQDLTKILTKAKNNNSDSSKNFPITRIFGNGKNYKEFASYLEALKNARDNGGRGGGGRSRSSAVAMSIKNGKLITIPLVNNKLVLSLKNTSKNNTPKNKPKNTP